jgi:hypothetical protein
MPELQTERGQTQKKENRTLSFSYHHLLNSWLLHKAAPMRFEGVYDGSLVVHNLLEEGNAKNFSSYSYHGRDGKFKLRI